MQSLRGYRNAGRAELQPLCGLQWPGWRTGMPGVGYKDTAKAAEKSFFNYLANSFKSLQNRWLEPC
jgi:hypothetical protein